MLEGAIQAGEVFLLQGKRVRVMGWTLEANNTYTVTYVRPSQLTELPEVWDWTNRYTVAEARFREEAVREEVPDEPIKAITRPEGKGWKRYQKKRADVWVYARRVKKQIVLWANDSQSVSAYAGDYEIYRESRKAYFLPRYMPKSYFEGQFFLAL